MDEALYKLDNGRATLRNPLDCKGFFDFYIKELIFGRRTAAVYYQY